MKFVRVLPFVLIILVCFLWFWSKDGIEPVINVSKNYNQISIYFDGTLIGKAQEKVPSSSVDIILRTSDLQSRYFHNSSSLVNNFILQEGSNIVKIHNPYNVVLDFKDPHNQSLYSFSLRPFRNLDSDFQDPSHLLSGITSSKVGISYSNGIKWILWLILMPFPFCLALYIFIFLTKKHHFNFVPVTQSKNQKILYLLIIAIAFGSFFWSRFLMKNYLADAPHVPDSVHYVLFSKILASGKTFLTSQDFPGFIPKNNILESTDNWLTQYQGRYFIKYLIGHPLVLALGQAFGHLNWIPPLVGSVTLILIGMIVWRVTQSIFFTVFSLILCFASPFFQTQTIDYMSHNTAALFLLISTIPFFTTKKYYLVGFFQGMLLNTRPLTFAATLPIIVIFILIKTKDLKTLIPIMVGLAPPVAIFFYYNYLTTGSILQTPYIYHHIMDKVGLGREYKLNYGLLNTFSNLAVFSLYFLKNYYLSFLPFSLSLVCLAIVPKSIKLNMAFLLSLSFGIIFIWTFYDGNFFMYGPRFIYEAVPFLVILFGYCLFTVSQIIPRTLYFILFFIVFNLSIFELSWLGQGSPEYSDIVYVPATISELAGFNYTSNKFNQFANNQKINYMKPCPDWWCVGEGIWLNNFPLTKQQTFFFVSPPNSISVPPNSQHINWQDL